jgi:hypothetical protein
MLCHRQSLQYWRRVCEERQILRNVDVVDKLTQYYIFVRKFMRTE